MKRRSFLKNAAFLTAAASAAPVLAGCRRQETGEEGSRLAIAFKVLQFTDTHYITGDPRSERALSNVREMLDAERPNLVIHTGDILFGHPDIPSAQEILQPIADRGIPFAVALGNHDSQFGATREEMFRVIREIPGCVNLPPKEGVYGCSNDVITLSGPGGVDRALYLFDSGALPVRFDGRRHPERGGGDPLLRLHPLLPVGMVSGTQCKVHGRERRTSRTFPGFLPYSALRGHGRVGERWKNPRRRERRATLPVPPEFGPAGPDAGVGRHPGRFSGCDTTYNHLGPSGARIFQFTQGARPFRTWVRLQGGEVRQDLVLDR